MRSFARLREATPIRRNRLKCKLRMLRYRTEVFGKENKLQEFNLGCVLKKRNQGVWLKQV
jgi:hypothetical protein